MIRYFFFYSSEFLVYQTGNLTSYCSYWIQSLWILQFLQVYLISKAALFCCTRIYYFFVFDSVIASYYVQWKLCLGKKSHSLQYINHIESRWWSLSKVLLILESLKCRTFHFFLSSCMLDANWLVDWKSWAKLCKGCLDQYRGK